MGQEVQQDQEDQAALVDQQGRFRLWCRGGQEDQLDLGSHWYHLFQVAQLGLGDPLHLKLLDLQLHLVDPGDQGDQGDRGYQETLCDPLCHCYLVHQVHLYHHEDLEDQQDHEHQQDQ